MENIVFKINDFGNYDMSRLNNLVKSCYEQNKEQGMDYAASSRTDEELEKLIHVSVFCVAYSGNEIVGLDGLKIKGHYGEIHTECLLPKFQGQGIMRRMRDILITYATESGLEYLMRSTAIKNTASVKSGLKDGFIPIKYYHPRKTHYYSVWMRKDLKRSRFSSSFVCKVHYWLSMLKTKMLVKENGEKTIVYNMLHKIKTFLFTLITMF